MGRACSGWTKPEQRQSLGVVSALSDGTGSPCSQTLLELLGGGLLVYSNRIGGSISADTLAVRVVLQVGDGRDVSVGGKEGGRLVGVDAEDVPAEARAWAGGEAFDLRRVSR
jgi:hypothetical protein